MERNKRKKRIVSQNAINIAEYIEKVADDDEIMKVLIALSSTNEENNDDEYEPEKPHSDVLHAQLQRSIEEYWTQVEEDVLFASEITDDSEI